MDDPQADNPRGNASEQLAQEAAMNDEMFDLGNHRLEELATDAGNTRTGRRRQEIQVEHRPAPSQPRQHGLIHPGAARWNSAVHEDVFDDDDRRVVSGLDSLDDGNAHRRSAASVTRTNGSQQSRPSQNIRSQEDYGGMNREIRQSSHYNAENPGYTRSNRKRGQWAQASEPDAEQTSLGGLVPPGGVVRRWDRSGSAHPGATNSGATDPGTAENMPGGGPGGNPGAASRARIGRPQQAPISGGRDPGTPIGGTHLAPLESGGGGSRGASQRSTRATFRGINPGHVRAGATTWNSLTDDSPRSAARSPTAISPATRPNVVNSIATSIPSMVASQRNTGEISGRSSDTAGRVPEQASASGAETPGVVTTEQPNQSNGSNYLAPHLRATPSQSAEFAAPTTSRQAQTSSNGQPQSVTSLEQSDQSYGSNDPLPDLRRTPGQIPLQTAGSATAIANQEVQSSGNTQTQSIASSELGRVIYRQEVSAELSSGHDKRRPGHVTIYEHAYEDTLVWEISTDDGRRLRGDVRSCIRLLPFGSNVYLRRQDDASSPIRSSALKFPDIPLVQQFAKFVTYHMKQLADRTKPKLKETLIDSSCELDASQAQTAVPEAPQNSSPTTTSQPFRGADEELSEQVAPLTGFISIFTDQSNDQGPEDAESHEDSSPVAIAGEELREQVGPTTQLTAISIDQSNDQEPLGAGSREDISLVVTGVEESVTQSEDASPSPAAQGESNLSTQATVLALSDLDTIEAIPLGRNLSQDSLHMLSTMSRPEYERMIKESRAIVQLLESRETSSTARWLKSTVLQIAANQLMRYVKFRTLGWNEQKKVCAVVYANVLHGDRPLIRSVEDMMDLRPVASPCPAVIRKFNNYVRWINEPKGQAADTDATAALTHTTNDRKPAMVSNGSTGQSASLNTNDVSTTYEITNSPSSTLSWARASDIPRAASQAAASNLGLNASPWAAREPADEWGSPVSSPPDARSHGSHANICDGCESTGIGDLSPLSGMVGQFRSLELSDNGDSEEAVGT
ncbi:hypothetical protein F5Y05DRAFT_424062 [Hypoxylon sp. FL0543]|nr:hypothetical protein F5Y05DRAFT_424062 [Hypoxylon sp. FL0543]